MDKLITDIVPEKSLVTGYSLFVVILTLISIIYFFRPQIKKYWDKLKALVSPYSFDINFLYI